MAVMKMPANPLRVLLPVAAAAGLAALTSVGGIHARQAVDEPRAPVGAQEGEESEGNIGDMAWVDPVITGPVSPEYRRIREEAGCDTATWPNIPDVCYPD